MRAVIRSWFPVGAVGPVGVIALFVMLVAGARPASAAPIAGLEYIETDLGGGLFQYDYTVRNLGDPLTDAGFDLFDFALFFGDTMSLMGDDTRNGAPADWQVIGGVGFIDATSLVPGAAPLGADIGPGGSLTGFSFIVDGRIGDTPFEALFANPNEPFDPIVVQGVSAAVPEPSALLLMVAALSLVLIAQRSANARLTTFAKATSALTTLVNMR